MKKQKLYVKGMHCASCNILIEDKFREVNNIKDVKADFRSQIAEVSYQGSLDKEALNRRIGTYGYQIVDPSTSIMIKESFLSRVSQVSAIFVIFLLLFFFAQELKILPDFSTSAELTLSVAFMLGLVASTSTCMATSGALFLSTVGKINSSRLSFKENIIPAISFNIGRVLSYGFFGFVLGFLGKSVAQNFQLGSYLMAFVALLMLLIGLDMMQLLPLKNIFNFGFSKSIFQRLEQNLIKNPKKTSFLLGVITYLLPCGFTQSVQLYALGLADPVKSAFIMMVFAIGTVPALLAIGFTSFFTRSSYYPLFSRTMGVLIFIIGLSYVSNTLSLHGINLGFTKGPQADVKNVFLQNGYQVANMKVDAYGYSPTSFTVEKGVPVKWIVKGENVFGCQGFLQAPSIGVQKTLQTGDNIIEFTPKEKGVIAFSCSMGMFRGNFLVI